MTTFLFALSFAASVLLTGVQQEMPCTGPASFAEDGSCHVQAEITLDITYPLLDDQPDIVREKIASFLQEQRSGFMTMMLDSISADIIFPGNLTIDYETYNFSGDVISYQFTIYEYTGGAHGNTYFRTFTFDVTDEREIVLDDVFTDVTAGLEAAAPTIRDSLSERLDDMADSQWLEDGTAPVVENYQHFALTEDTLLFFFPPYQVAPYAAGPQTVSVPLSALDGVLAPAFASAG